MVFSLLLVGCSAGNDAAPQPGDEAEPSKEPAPAAPADAGAFPAAGGRTSQYTSLDDCRLLEAKPEEAGYSSSACPGVGGYSLRLIDADARQNLFVTPPGGSETSLALSEAAGSGFSRLGQRIEWRGTQAAGRFIPSAMIVRYFVVEAEGGAEVSYLLAINLGEGGPCVAAVVAPGPDQNEQAQAAVDGAMRCLRPPR
jgi:hypothetical protein